MQLKTKSVSNKPSPQKKTLADTLKVSYELLNIRPTHPRRRTEAWNSTNQQPQTYADASLAVKVIGKHQATTVPAGENPHVKMKTTSLTPITYPLTPIPMV